MMIIISFSWATHLPNEPLWLWLQHNKQFAKDTTNNIIHFS